MGDKGSKISDYRYSRFYTIENHEINNVNCCEKKLLKKFA